jgi:hypothetical protein
VLAAQGAVEQDWAAASPGRLPRSDKARTRQPK